MTNEAVLRPIVERIREEYPAGEHGHEMAVQDIMARGWTLCDIEAGIEMLSRRNMSESLVEFGEVKVGEL